MTHPTRGAAEAAGSQQSRSLPAAAIICGGGKFPLAVATAAQRSGRDILLIGLIGAAIITPAFVLSFTLGRLVYGVTEAAMHLGMSMGLREMVVALVACVIMTVVSSLFAIRRLWRVDPIMLFE